MRVVPFDKNSFDHVSKMVDILYSRNMDPNLIKDLPKNGWIAIEDDLPVAYGALRCVEGDRAMFDSYITNLRVDGNKRHRALDMLTAKLIKVARHHDIKQLLFFSRDTSILDRAERHGLVSPSNYEFKVINLHD
jgi:hypothetical protein